MGFNAYDLIGDAIETKQAPSAFAILQLSTSILFFGHSVYNFRFASTIINEAQTNSLNSVSQNLSNKQR